MWINHIISKIKLFGCWILGFISLVLIGCRPELPVTTFVMIDFEALSLPTNALYGYNLEEVNHAIEGGLYPEMIRNGSFEEGVLPLFCVYQRSTSTLITPNGYSMPFPNPQTVPGWRSFGYSYMDVNAQDALFEYNKRSLVVTARSDSIPSGVEALGFSNMMVRKGKDYRVSGYSRLLGLPTSFKVMLVDTVGNQISNEVLIRPQPKWEQFNALLTAEKTNTQAILRIEAVGRAYFRLDEVSLLPLNTKQIAGLPVREDLYELLKDLYPKFIRFPGGEFVNGYTSDTYPWWENTIGQPKNRKGFWNVWGYYSHNRVGFREYLELIRSIGAEPLYVINVGMTSASRLPRVHDFTKMSAFLEGTISAINYANQPLDSLYGKMRYEDGSPSPFDLKSIELGHAQSGLAYEQRYELFRKKLMKEMPGINIIHNGPIVRKSFLSDWTDIHYQSNALNFMSLFGRHPVDSLSSALGAGIIGYFSVNNQEQAGTMGGALGEACLMIESEQNPLLIKRLAYSPILGHVDRLNTTYPAIIFNDTTAVVSPSYYVLKQFSQSLGTEVLKTSVDTYMKPYITYGKVGLTCSESDLILHQILLNDRQVPNIKEEIVKKRRSFSSKKPISIFLGDSLDYNYRLTYEFSFTKSVSSTKFIVRDNGRRGIDADYYYLNLTSNGLGLFHQAGNMHKELVEFFNYDFKPDINYQITINCIDDKIDCFLNGQSVISYQSKPIPSVLAIASMDKEAKELYLKLVNTTRRTEKTKIGFKGKISLNRNVDVWELSGEWNARNTFDRPLNIKPITHQASIPLAEAWIYELQPFSVTVFKLKIN